MSNAKKIILCVNSINRSEIEKKIESFNLKDNALVTANLSQVLKMESSHNSVIIVDSQLVTDHDFSSLKDWLNTTSANSQNEQVTPLTWRNITVYPQDYMVKRDNDKISVTPTQFELLVCFLSHPERLLTRDDLKQMVWPTTAISPRSIDAHISKLKRTLPEIEEDLGNIYGKGYIFSSSTEQKMKFLKKPAA